MRTAVSASIALTIALALPGVAGAQAQMTKDQLIGIAIESGACGKAGTVVDARFKEGSSTEIVAECGTGAGEQVLAGGMNATGPIAFGALLLFAVAASGGGSDSTRSTTGTNGTN